MNASKEGKYDDEDKMKVLSPNGGGSTSSNNKPPRGVGKRMFLLLYFLSRSFFQHFSSLAW